MTITIALDAMGGDQSPEVVIKGAALFVENIQSKCHFLIYGDQPSIEKFSHGHEKLFELSKVIHTDRQITNTTKPSTALRQASKTGMGLAIQAVSEKRAHAVVSAGNTGALMALGRMLLKTLDGVDRPAIAKTLPSITGKVIVLDLGANAECKKENLIQFALMGEALASYTQTHKPDHLPTVGLLNIGSEASKGLTILQEIAKDLQNLVNFYGFVEGDDIAKGTTDVVVTDGFTGNVTLKTIEGTAKLIKHFLKSSFDRNLWSRLSYLIARPVLRQLSLKIDPRLYNGAILLGLRGIVVKSHGGADDISFANAIQVAFDLAKNHKRTLENSSEPSFNHLIQERLSRINRVL